MHPAPSIILFTVLSGIGFGMIGLLGLGISEPPASFLIAGCAMFFSCTGLIASTFHLGHPERALRALTQWRTSWLSREGVLAIVTLFSFSLYMLLWLLRGYPSVMFGAFVFLMAGLTIFATSMIYKQLKTVPRWNHNWTPLLFLSTGGGGAFSFLVFIERIFYPPTQETIIALYGFLGVAALVSLVWTYHALKTTHSSTPETATRLGNVDEEVFLFESPHSAPNYLLKEMVFEVGRQKARGLRILGFFLGYAVPLLCFVVFLQAEFFISLVMAGGGCLSHLLGVLGLRWLFFAEARHVVELYYGRR